MTDAETELKKALAALEYQEAYGTPKSRAWAKKWVSASRAWVRATTKAVDAQQAEVRARAKVLAARWRD